MNGTGRPVVTVLGGTGCVGGAVAAAFADAGHSVLGVARRRPQGTPGRQFSALDVAAADPAHLAELLAAASTRIVVNATGGWLYTDEANEYAHVRLVENLLDGLALLPRSVRLIQIGSIHEYGPVPMGSAIDESVEPRPVSTYARTKLRGADAVLRATAEGRVDGVVLRAVNLCGPGVSEASFVGTAVRKLHEATPGRPAELTVGRAQRDYLDTRDLATAVVSAAVAPAVGQVINIGRGEVIPMHDLIDLLVAVSGVPTAAVRVREASVDSKGEDWTLADITRATRLLGWKPRFGPTDSVKDMWDASRDH